MGSGFCVPDRAPGVPPNQGESSMSSKDVRADALPAGAVQAPRPARGADLRAWRYATQQKHPVLWGPVPAAEAARIAGAPAGCESVLIAPAIPSDLLRDVENLIPASVKRSFGLD